MSEPDPLLPFAERPAPPESLRPPAVMIALAALAIIGGALLGWVESGSAGYRLMRGIFFAAALSYLVFSLYDFWEHFRLEKAATGRWWAISVVPLGESINHAATAAVIVVLLVLARPLPPVLEPRDWLVVGAPALFLLLGWRDELFYHRKRCAHREDIMHTVSHLAAGVMISAWLATRLFVW